MSENLRTSAPATKPARRRKVPLALALCQVMFMTEEDLEAYKILAAKYRADLKPQGAREEQLAEMLADVQWTMRRLNSAQMTILASRLDGRDEDSTPGWYRFDYRDLEMLVREEERVILLFSRTVEEFTSLQDKRKRRQVQ